MRLTRAEPFGCQALTRLPQLYGKDEELMGKFQAFQKACMHGLQKAKITRAVEQRKLQQATEID